ncbi:MAG: NUDIX hydrolase [Alphaproteobacteria bacterium]
MSWFQAIMPKEQGLFGQFRRHIGGDANARPIRQPGETGPSTKAETCAYVQYGALLYRERKGVEVLLVTSRESGRWVIPKGWPMKHKSAAEAAAREAFEEAGVTCRVKDDALGAFHYLKRLKSGDAVECEVVVFPMSVGKEHSRWPEKHERKRRWFAIADAAEAVDEQELMGIILQFGRDRSLKG